MSVTAALVSWTRSSKRSLFRYSVIADIIQLPLQHRGLYKLLTEKAEREYNIPGSLRRRVAAETIGGLRVYRRGGFDALLPKERADTGSTRAIPSHGDHSMTSVRMRSASSWGIGSAGTIFTLGGSCSAATGFLDFAWTLHLPHYTDPV